MSLLKLNLLKKGNDKIIQHESDWVIFCWLLGLILIPQIVSAALIIFIIQFIPEVNSTNDNYNILISIFSSLLSPLIFFPLLKKAHNVANYSELFSKVAFKKIATQKVIKYLIIVVGLMFTFEWCKWILNTPVEPFLLGIKNAVHSPFLLSLSFIIICIFVPIMEELVFRGWLLDHLINTKLKVIGAISVSSFIFSLVHFQYESLVTFIIVFIFGIVLGLVKVITSNSMAPIIMHSFANIFSFLNIMFFISH